MNLDENAAPTNAWNTTGPWQPLAIGPSFDWLDHGRIRLTTGRLAGREFGIKTEVHKDRAAASLTDNRRRVGQCYVERNPPDTVTLWDIGVRPELRRAGLCAVMTWVLFREFLLTEPSSSFRVRMVTSVRPGEITGLQNVGICVVANRLGMTSDFNTDKLLAPKNISNLELIPAHDGIPPYLKATVKAYPLVALCLVLDPDTHRPSKVTDLYYQFVRDHRTARDWAQAGNLIVSNGDYSLRARGIDRFLRAMAVDAEEAVILQRRLRPLP